MSKYHARRVKEDNKTFDSKAEHRRYCELKLLEKVGKIMDLSVHPSFPIFIDKIKICNVIFDFEYIELSSKLKVLEDVKGVDLPMSRIKRKLFTAKYPDRVLRILRAK